MAVVLFVWWLGRVAEARAHSYEQNLKRGGLIVTEIYSASSNKFIG